MTLPEPFPGAADRTGNLTGATRRRLRQLLLVGACLFAAAPVAAQQGANYYEDGLRRFDAKDIPGAIIQLKNALQQNPNLLPAQVLLADAYLIEGAPAAAQAAMEAAERLGADRSVVRPGIARALLGQFKYRELLDRVSPQGLLPLVEAEVLGYRAAAYMGLGDLKSAEQALRAAERLNPESVSIRVAQGTLKLRQGNRQDAQAIADRAVAMAPREAGVWNLKAAIAHVAGQNEAALSAYGKALELEPTYLDARLARAGLLMDLQRHQQAEPDLNALKRHAAGDPRVAYLLALDASRRGDQEATRRALSEATAVLDQLPPEMIKGNAQLLMLGGLAHYGLKQPAKARSYLQGYMSIEPRHPGARKLLAAILLDERDYNRVIELLYPLAGGSTPDPQALTLLGSAYMGKKKYQLASELFEQAARLSPGSAADAGVGLGLSHLGAGRVEQGMAQLRAVFDKDPGQTRAGMMLASRYLAIGDAARAADIARRMVAREPDNLTALNLLGVALRAARDAAGARAAFTRAAQLQRNFLPAQLNLARLDIAEGKAEAARKRLNAIIKASSDNPDALLELARLEAMQQRPAEAIRWLQRLRPGQNQAMTPLLYLVELYLQGGNAKSALALARELEALHPDNLSVLAAVGQSYQASGNTNQARLSFNRMTKVNGVEANDLNRIARFLIGVRAFDDAGAALKKALTFDPAHLPSQITLVELDLQAGRLAAAEQRAVTLRSAHPRNTAIARLLGAVYMARNKSAAAVAEFKEALARERSGANTLALFQAYLAAGETRSAIDLMQGWLRDHPADAAAEAALAEAHMVSGQWQQARTTYLAYLKKRPKDARALNNLANVLMRLNDPKALDYARQAQALAPEDPHVADTLGWILVGRGQAQQALPYLRDARLRAAGNRVIQYHLGVALSQLGRKAEAKRELQGALSGPGDFDGKAEARALLQQL
jgi:cellulose synthase operon protein C